MWSCQFSILSSYSVLYSARALATAARSVLASARKMSFCALVVRVPVSAVSLRRFRIVVSAVCCAVVNFSSFVIVIVIVSLFPRGSPAVIGRFFLRPAVAAAEVLRPAVRASVVRKMIRP